MFALPPKMGSDTPQWGRCRLPRVARAEGREESRRSGGPGLAEAHGDDVGVTSEPHGLAALLFATRAAYQANLLEMAELRRQLDLDIAAVRASADQDSRAFQPDESMLARFSQAWAQYGDRDSSPPSVPAPPQRLDEAIEAWRVVLQRCTSMLERFRREHQTWANTKTGLFRRAPAEPRLQATFKADVDTLRQISEALPALRTDFVRGVENAAVPKLRSTFEGEAAARDRQLTKTMQSNLAAIQLGVELLGPSGQSWDRRLAPPVELSTMPTAATRLGDISSGLPAPHSINVPCFIGFPASRGLALDAPLGSRDRAVELLRSLVLRLVLDVPPGQMELSLIDPTAMGQTFSDFLHLGDYDERLIDGGVKTSSQSIDRCLSGHVAHLGTVVSKYLRGQFQNIHDYNRSAGEMAEPYRVIVIADYPRQFSDRAAEQLLSLVENGPRCGVYTAVLYSSQDEAPRSVPFARLTQAMDVVTFRGDVAALKLADSASSLDFTPDRCPSVAFDAEGRATTPAAQFLEAIGSAAKRGADVVVTLDNFLPVVNRNRGGALPEFFPGAPPLGLEPETWWTATTAHMAVAPIGRAGAQGVASMFFSSTTVAGGAIMVGLPRSGKTTSLHAMILTMAMLYSPDELELYLIDAKHGVEFKAYEHVPHARMVSVHSEREFSLAVLKSIQAKIKERAQLIKSHGGGLSNITEYRRATGEVLPRIVVVVDEFHELFEEADAIGLEAFAAFSDIVRMGPFSGVHIVVASQTLSSMPAMDRQTLILLPQRVAFMCNEYDAEIVMGDTNKAARMLSKTGQGLFNPSRGEESKNQPFQGLYVTPEQRGGLLRALRQKADASGWSRQPRVFDGDAVVERPLHAEPMKSGARFTVPIGEPFTLADSESLALSRTRGANLLLVGDRDDEEAPDLSLRGVLHSVLLAARAQGSSSTTVDFIGDEQIDDGLTMLDVADAAGSRYLRSSSLATALRELAALVSTRTSAGNYRDRTHLLVLFGLQRALSLAPYDPYSLDASDEPSMAQLLSAIVVSGPEVGVHVVVDADRSRSVESRLGSDLIQEFMIRMAGSAADTKDLSLVSGSYGETSPLRFGQLLIGDHLKGTTKRARGYEILRAATIGSAKETTNGE
jgi:DNA segregation ATPase FtsK/SpoIIIE, S-DNA-T family